MAEIAKSSSRIAAFAESAPGLSAILGWLAAEIDSYIYLARADGMPTFHAGQEREGDPLVTPVPGESVWLCAVGSDDRELLSHAALLISGAMARERAESAMEAKNHGDLLRSLLLGDPDAAERARLAGWELEREVFLIVARFETTDVEELAEEWRRIIRLRDPKGIVVFFPSEIVAVMSKDSLHPRAFAQSLPQGDGWVGTSRTGTAHSDIAALYRQAELAVTVAKSIGKKESVYSLDDLGSYRLLALIDDSRAIDDFLTDTLKSLALNSDHEAGDMRRTLSALLDNNLNIAVAARALHFHYNTLRYRIVKLEKMLGPFTTDAELRLSLALALRLHSLRFNS